MNTPRMIDKPLTSYTDEELNEALEKTKRKLELLRLEALNRMRIKPREK